MALLANHGLYIRKIGDKTTFLGGYSVTPEQWGEYIEDEFIVFKDNGYWSARLAGPGHSSTIIKISQELDDVIYSVLAFFEVKARVTIPSIFIRDLLWWLQRAGFCSEISAQGYIEVNAIVNTSFPKKYLHPDDFMMASMWEEKSDMKVVVNLQGVMCEINQTSQPFDVLNMNMNAGELSEIVKVVESLF